MELIHFLSTLGQLGQLYCGFGVFIVPLYLLFIFRHKLQYSESTLQDFPFQLASFAALVIIFLAIGTSFGRFLDDFFRLKSAAFGLTGALVGVTLGIVVGIGVWRQK